MKEDIKKRMDVLEAIIFLKDCGNFSMDNTATFTINVRDKKSLLNALDVEE